MNTKIALEPAASIIAKFGGPDVVQEITKASRTRVYRWTQPKEAGGTGGIIPIQHASQLLIAAKDRDIAVTAEDFMSIPTEMAS